jgi:hypothetical protein
MDAQVVLFTCAVEFLAFWGSLAIVIATMKRPTAKRAASWIFLERTRQRYAYVDISRVSLLDGGSFNQNQNWNWQGDKHNIGDDI